LSDFKDCALATAIKKKKIYNYQEYRNIVTYYQENCSLSCIVVHEL